MPESARAELERLLPGERLLWVGRPDSSRRFAPADRVLIPLSLLVLSYGIFELSISADWLGRATGGGLTAFALWILIGRFGYKTIRASRTLYGLAPGLAVIAVGNTVTGFPLGVSPPPTTVSRDGTHMTVNLGASMTGEKPELRRGLWSVANTSNTGVEFLSSGSYASGFFDVTDVAGLTLALQAAVEPADDGPSAG